MKMARKKKTEQESHYERFTTANSGFSEKLCELVNKYLDWAELQEKEQNRKYCHPILNLQKYPNAKYEVFVGARSTGKTFEPLALAILMNLAGEGVFGYIRRYEKTITTKNMSDLCGAQGEMLNYVTEGEYNHVAWYQGRFWLERWRTNEETGVYEKEYRNPVPCGGAWAMNVWENDKGPDFSADKGGMSVIILDEFLSKGARYIDDEWAVFQNVTSSLIRNRVEKGTKIFLLANPVSKWRNPYFSNMGIRRDIFETPGTYELTYPKAPGQKKPMTAIFTYISATVDKDGNAIDVDPARTQLYNEYFAFPNSRGKSMSITHGIWEMEDAATLPDKYINNSETKKTFYFKAAEDAIFGCSLCKYLTTNQYYLWFFDCEEIPEDEWYFTLLPELEKRAIIALDPTAKLTPIFLDVYKSNRLFYENLDVADAFHGWIKDARKYIA